jgi:hypothetical protein
MSTYETTERDFLFNAIAGRDRFIAQLELENHTLRALLEQRDLLLQDMRDVMSVSSSASVATEYTTSATPAPTPVPSPAYNSAATGFTITATEEPITIVTVVPSSAVEAEHALSAETSVVEDATVKQSRRKVSDYLEPGDTIRHAIRGKGEWRLTYTGSVFVHEVTGDSYKSLQAVAKAHREGKGHYDGWHECMVERPINGVSTWTRLSKLEKQTA